MINRSVNRMEIVEGKELSSNFKIYRLSDACAQLSESPSALQRNHAELTVA